MKGEPVTDSVIKQFLLGEVDDEERERLERLFISDPESREKILSVEEDLLEDYLENSLTTPDRAKFLAQYGHTPEQRRKLRISKSIKEHALKEYAVAEATLSQSGLSASSRWRNIFSALWLHNRILFVPIAVTLMIAMVVAVVFLANLNRRRAEDNNRHQAIERELADVNGPSYAGESSSEVFSLVLPPVSVRSVAPQPEVSPRADAHLVELRLLWIQKDQYPGYRAVLSRVGSTEKYTITNLRVEKAPSGSAIRVRLPVHFLVRGLYQVSLSGVATDGTDGVVEEYSFSVGG
jgi:hypothetical protein